MELHDRIVKELDRTKSLAALIWLVQQGREVEFTVEGKGYFFSRSRVLTAWRNYWKTLLYPVPPFLPHGRMPG